MTTVMAQDQENMEIGEDDSLDLSRFSSNSGTVKSARNLQKKGGGFDILANQ